MTDLSPLQINVLLWCAWYVEEEQHFPTRGAAAEEFGVKRQSMDSTFSSLHKKGYLEIAQRASSERSKRYKVVKRVVRMVRDEGWAHGLLQRLYLRCWSDQIKNGLVRARVHLNSGENDPDTTMEVIGIIVGSLEGKAYPATTYLKFDAIEETWTARAGGHVETVSGKAYERRAAAVKALLNTLIRKYECHTP